MKKLYPHSGHYRPKDRNLCWLLKFLLRKSIPIANILVDAQRVFKCSRQSDGKGIISIIIMIFYEIL